MNKLPRSSTGKQRATVVVRDIMLYQAYDQISPSYEGGPTFILAENEIGETIFALPGGGRATLLDLRKRLEST